MNHSAIYRAYPNVVTIDDGAGAFDADGKPVELDQAKVDAAAILVAQEQALATAERNRSTAYQQESDPLLFKYLAGEVDKADWLAKREDIRKRHPYPLDAATTTEEVTP
jgi:hypothetical protein